jgi:hypothetical protein
MKLLISVGSLLLLAAACHRKEPPPPTPAQTPHATRPADTAQNHFFPIADYIRTEISTVDSTPIAILKYSIENGRTDSAFISSPVFHQLALQFIMPDLDSAFFEKNYSQKTFMDETNDLLTFTYSPLNKDQPLQRADVLINTEANNQVKSIYLEKTYSSGDTVITKKFLWRAKKSFLVITTLQPPQKTTIVRQVKVVWDPSQ